MLTTRLLQSEYKAIRHKSQTSRRYGRKQSWRVETGLRAGNFVCFIPRESRGLDKCGVNNNKELPQQVCCNFDAFSFWNQHNS